MDLEVLDTARVTVLFEGMIQGVGFRSVVKHTAMSLGVKGLVRNLEDGRVEAFFDGEMDKVEKLLRALDITGKENDPFSLNVSRMVTHWEGAEGYTPAWRTYRRFAVDYGVREPDSRYEDEIIDSLEVAKSSFTMLRASLDEFRDESKDSFTGLRGDVTELRGEVNTGFTGLRGDITELRGEVNTGFTGLRGDITELRGEVNAGFTGLKGEISELRGEVNTGFKALRGDISELRCDVNTGFTGLRGDVSELHGEVKNGFTGNRADLVGIRDDMNVAFTNLKESMESGRGANIGTSKQNEDRPHKPSEKYRLTDS